MYIRFALLMTALGIALSGCNSSGTPGGPGATNTPGEKKNSPTIGQAEQTFTLSVPSLSLHLKQGEAKAVSIAINRGKNFEEDVSLKFEHLPTGVTIDPEAPKIAHNETEAKFTVRAADAAAVGDFTIKAIGHPTKGADAVNEFKIAVGKK